VAALSGVLVTLCFAPFEQTWICWIALTPLLGAVWFSGEGAKRRWLRDLLLGYLAGVIFFWGVFYWLYTVTVPGLVFVGLYMGVYFAIWSWVAGLSRPGKLLPASVRGQHAWLPPQPNELPPEARSPWLSSLHNLRLAFILAAAWTALEWVRSWMFSGWGWNGLGVALHNTLPIIQVAEFTGVSVCCRVCQRIVSTARRFMLERRCMRRPHYDFTLTIARSSAFAALIRLLH
jgi:apolipoprotein N-acyltransferase